MTASGHRLCASPRRDRRVGSYTAVVSTRLTPAVVLFLTFGACSSNGSSGPGDGAADVPRDGATAPADIAGGTSDGPGGASDGPGGTSDGPGDTGDGAASRAFRVVFESNGSATPGGAAVIRGEAAFRLPPQATRLVLAGIEVLSDGDSPPSSFGGGGVSLEISRGLPFATGTTQLAREWLGTCDGRPMRPCWTGPTFDPPVIIEAGQQNVFVTIDRSGGEGGVFMLPVAGDASAAQKQESWGRGGVRWTQAGQLENHTDWTRAPADQPWIFRLLVESK
jgi:hypothetical protein